MAVDDGGPAFPVVPVHHGHSPDSYGTGYGANPGMSLLDYEAIHTPQPGTVEAYQLCGSPDVPAATGIYNSIEYRATQWWYSLSLEEKYRIVAELKYRFARAMLAERKRLMGGSK